jgi:hypothetical protein
MLQSCRTLSIEDDDQILTHRLLELLLSSYKEEYMNALWSFVAICTPHDVELARQTFETIRQDRRKLQALVEAFFRYIHHGWHKSELFRKQLPIIQALLSVLENDLATAMLRVELGCRTLRPQEIIILLVNMAQHNQLHPAALVAVSTVFSSPGQTALSQQEFAEIEQILAPQADERLRYLAVIALQTQSFVRSSAHWTPERIARLQTFRNDPSPLVAETAQFIFTPDLDG